MNTAMNGFRDILTKEIIHILRDPATLVIALMIPVVQLILFGYAIDYDVRHIPTAIVDLDRSRESHDYIAGLKNTQYLDVVSYLPTTELAHRALQRNDARVAVVIPPDFSRRFGTKLKPTVYVMLDGSDSQVANPARNAFLRPSPSSLTGIDVRYSVLFNPEMRTQIYTIPGLVCVLLQMITVSLTSFSLVREREMGTLEQLMVSPIGRLGLMLGKLIPYSIIGMLELLSVLFMGRMIFGVHIVGSLLLLLVLAIPFIMAALSMGLFISTIAQNQAQALQMTMLTALPSILLSGYIAPRDTLPAPLFVLSDFFPVTHFIRISRGIVVRGAGLTDLMPSVYWLLFLTALLITAATFRFRKSNS